MNIYVLILVGLLINGLLGYLVYRKFSAVPAYGRNQRPVIKSLKSKPQETSVTEGVTGSKQHALGRKTSWWWSVIALSAIVVVGFGAFKYFSQSEPPAVTIWTITVGREWSAWVSVPLGEQIFWEPVETVAYEIQKQTGEIYLFPLELKEHVRIPGRLSSIRFRVTDDTRETATFRLRLSPM